jgi:N-methylhydantoinase A
MNWRVLCEGPRPELRLTALEGVTAAGTARKGLRPVYFADAGGWIDTPVYDRYALGPGTTFAGPAIVEERESTAVIGPGASCRVDEGLTLVVQLP